MSLIKRYSPLLLLAAILAFTALIYWPGLHGGFLFDDFPNIVENKAIQPANASFSSLVRAALSSPSSDLKRPLASLTIALNFLASGLDPHAMKATNLAIHLANGVLVFLLLRCLFSVPRLQVAPSRGNKLALLISFAWLVVPINLTGVLYVVQRMESLANLFVLAGLLGYIAGRKKAPSWRGFLLAAGSLIAATAVGVLAKETAVMLPLYAFLTEWIVFRFALTPESSNAPLRDKRVITLFTLILVLPMALGLAWLIPGAFNPAAWVTRDFGLYTRLLSELRVVVSYIAWTIVPTTHDLSFYHDNFVISHGWLKPASTIICAGILSTLLVVVFHQRVRRPLLSLGIALFIACHLLTGTIIPLELVYEHRNYFASLGVLLAFFSIPTPEANSAFALARSTLLVALFIWWCGDTFVTAQAWGSPLQLSEELADRAPDSPRAQYELGRTYIIYSSYDPASPFTAKAYAPLERAAALPDSSILPEQALIFMNARMHLTIKNQWWESLTQKLASRKSTVQDESSLAALVTCARDGECDLPVDRMMSALRAALSHPNPNGRLLSIAGDYVLNVVHDTPAALTYFRAAVKATPSEPIYKVTLARVLIVNGAFNDAYDVLATITPEQDLMLPANTLSNMKHCIDKQQQSCKW